MCGSVWDKNIIYFGVQSLWLSGTAVKAVNSMQEGRKLKTHLQPLCVEVEVYFRYSCFLGPKSMQVTIAANSKYPLVWIVWTGVCFISLPVALWWAGDLSKVSPTCCPLTAEDLLQLFATLHRKSGKWKWMDETCSHFYCSTFESLAFFSPPFSDF